VRHNLWDCESPGGIANDQSVDVHVQHQDTSKCSPCCVLFCRRTPVVHAQHLCSPDLLCKVCWHTLSGCMQSCTACMLYLFASPSDIASFADLLRCPAQNNNAISCHGFFGFTIADVGCLPLCTASSVKTPVQHSCAGVCSILNIWLICR